MTGQQLKIVNDARVSLDKETGVVRSFFGAELVHVPEDEKLFDMHTDLAFKDEAHDFLNLNDQYFQLKNIAFEVSELRKGQATTTVRYQQWHGGLLVYGAELLVSIRNKDGRIISVVNNIDYSIANQLQSDHGSAEVDVKGTIAELFGNMVHSFKITMGPLFIYRHQERELILPARGNGLDHQKVMELQAGEKGKVYLVRQVKVDTQTPSGNWEILVETATGVVVAVFDRRSYLPPKALVFEPDPITSSGQDTLTWETEDYILDSLRVEVNLEDLDQPAPNGNWFLSGSWVKCVDIEPHTFPPPASMDGNFFFGSKDHQFLFAMVYYWATRLIKYLRGFQVPAFNNSVVGPFKMDPLGLEIDGLVGELAKAENSVFKLEADDTPCIVFGEGGVPDASDAHVIVHEYGHAMHHFLNSRQGSYEEGFCDFLAVAWLDRYNKNGLPREIVFPWDNNISVNWDPHRRIDRRERFDDQTSYRRYLIGDIWATALWDLFLSIGCNGDPTQRISAADDVIRLYMEMLLLVPSYVDRERLGHALMEADKAVHGYPGKYRQQIWDAFKARGLWTGTPPPLAPVPV